jgi:hypothetical protein
MDSLLLGIEKEISFFCSYYYIIIRQHASLVMGLRASAHIRRRFLKKKTMLSNTLISIQHNHLHFGSVFPLTPFFFFFFFCDFTIRILTLNFRGNINIVTLFGVSVLYKISSQGRVRYGFYLFLYFLFFFSSSFDCFLRDKF